MSDISTAIGEAARWLRECHDWMLANDLDGGCPMTANPLDLAEGLEALTTRLAPDRTGEEMTLEIALDFADNPRPFDSLQAPADSEYELREALRVIAAAYRAALTPATAPDREAIARIIDPLMWSNFDDGVNGTSGCSRFNHGTPDGIFAELDQGYWLAGVFFPGRLTLSLAKADAILSLMGEG